MRIPSLPSDIISQILSFLHDDLHSLTCCSITSHTFAFHARPLIFRSLNLGEHTARFHASSRLAQYLQLVQLDPKITQYTRSLSICLRSAPAPAPTSTASLPVPPNKSKAQNRLTRTLAPPPASAYPNFTDDPALLTAASLPFPLLESIAFTAHPYFRLNYKKVSPELGAALNRLLRSYRIESVQLAWIDNVPRILLMGTRCMRNLKLDCVKFCTGNSCGVVGPGNGVEIGDGNEENRQKRIKLHSLEVRPGSNPSLQSTWDFILGTPITSSTGLINLPETPTLPSSTTARGNVDTKQANNTYLDLTRLRTFSCIHGFDQRTFSAWRIMQTAANTLTRFHWHYDCLDIPTILDLSLLPALRELDVSLFPFRAPTASQLRSVVRLFETGRTENSEMRKVYLTLDAAKASFAIEAFTEDAPCAWVEDMDDVLGSQGCMERQESEEGIGCSATGRLSGYTQLNRLGLRLVASRSAKSASSAELAAGLRKRMRKLEGRGMLDVQVYVMAFDSSNSDDY
ncbi:hypothetical protein FA15DRAFT_704911 [Coprinopsis marcescibilis]|uniref:F-box domain-containing protein n=1 Tax=Coprinopsis marcescibilis TaxID=230819 RepID=A0A5C3L737_COPMA|nr:hypothetical protein FA15DRAFT_704911 [Coprinopsis marcescibilis]